MTFPPDLALFSREDLLALVAGITIVTSLHRGGISDREKERRAQKAGGAVGVVTLVIVTPFWLVGATRFGRERRQAREAGGNTP